MRKIKGGAAVDSLMLTFVRIATALISIVIYKLLAVNFSLEEYGLYSQAMLVVTTATSITIFGMTDAINYFYNKGKDSLNGRTYIQTIFALQFIIGLVCAIVIIAFKKQIALYFGNASVSAVIPYIALLPLLTNLFNMLQVLFVSNRRAKIIAMRNLILSFLKVLIIVIVCFYIKDIKYVLVSTFFIDFISIIYMLAYCAKIIFKIDPRKADFHFTRDIFIYSIPMAAYIITNSLSRNMDKLVIGWLADTKSLALYTIAAKELPFDMLTSAFMTVLIPYITRSIVIKDYKNAGRTFSKYTQISYVITWIVGVGAIFLSKDFMLVLYDEKYLPALNIFRIYMIIDMTKFANASLVFSAEARTNELLMYSFAALGLNLVMNIVFYKLFGLTGPALATAVITLVLSFVMLARSAHILKSNFIEIIQIHQAILILIEAILFGIVANTIAAHFFENTNNIIRFIIGYVTYFIPMILLNFQRIINLLKLINQEKLL